MKNSLSQAIGKEVEELFKFKKTQPLRHIPILASLCVGTPLLCGLYFNNIHSGALASLAGTVILYIPVSSFSIRMRYLLTCSFGFMISAMVGLIFSFNPYVAAIALGLFTFAAHWVSLYFNLKPPGSFFFIMIASITICIPFNLTNIPEKMGLIGLGTMTACLLALLYSALTWKKNLNRVGGANAPSSHTTVRTVPYTAVQ